MTPFLHCANLDGARRFAYNPLMQITRKSFLSLENLTLLALGTGILAGSGIPAIMQSTAWVGQLFLQLLKMILIPIVSVSVFLAMLESKSTERVRKLGLWTLAYYLTTTALAVLLGLFLVQVLHPGAGRAPLSSAAPVDLKKLELTDLLLGMIPSNVFESLARGRVLPVLVFSLLMGLAVLSLPPEQRTHLERPARALNDALMHLTRWVIALTPLGVLSLVGTLVAREGLEPFRGLLTYVLTVLLGLGLHAGITLPLLARVVGQYAPYRYFLQIREALLLAFSTASSSATLPVSLRVAQDRGEVRSDVAAFVLPLGATINMDGTALYEAVATVFIAQLYGIQLKGLELLMVFLTATLASIGAAGIPGAGLVTMGLVLQSVGLPLEGIAVILTVDRFLDMVRTAVNVWGDLVGARVIQRFLSPSLNL